MAASFSWKFCHRNIQASRQACYLVAVDVDIKRCWQCNVQHYIFTVHIWAMWTTTHCWGDFPVEARNNCCLELNSSTVTGMVRRAWRGSGWQWWVMEAARQQSPQRLRGYLLQQMGLCTFSTVIQDWNRGTGVIVCYWTSKFSMTVGS